MEDEITRIKELQQRIALYEDMKAYRLLYDLLFKGLHSFSYAFVKSSEAAEEIVSDVFIKLWQIRNELTTIQNLKVYLFIIAKHFSLNYITKHHKNPIISLEEMEVETMIEIGDPEEICISADTLDKIREAVNQLPPQCRIIFQLVKEEGLKYKEVAAILHISILTVRNQVAIATKKIAAHLGRPQTPRTIPPPRKFSDS
ncbi:MAG: RNA polymerase sigma-70 factor [Chitinophaga rupis]